MLEKAGIALSLLAVVSCPLPVAAQDTLDSVLARMQVSDTRRFNYRETRHLALLAKPWEASGEMYISPDRLLIVQQQPAPGITDITRSRLLHIDPEHHVVRSMELASPFGVQGLEPFLQLLYGESAGSTLQKHYATSFKVDQARWQLNLYPVLEHSGAISQMWLAGDEGQGADYLEVEFEDQDRTEYRLSMIDRGAPARLAMQRVIEQAEQ